MKALCLAGGDTFQNWAEKMIRYRSIHFGFFSLEAPVHFFLEASQVVQISRKMLSRGRGGLLIPSFMNSCGSRNDLSDLDKKKNE